MSYFHEEIYSFVEQETEWTMKCTIAAVNHISHWVALLFHSVCYLCWWKFPIKPKMKSQALFTECLIRNWCSIYIPNILFRNSSARVCTIFLCSLITEHLICQGKEGESWFFFFLTSHQFLFQFFNQNQKFFICVISATLIAIIFRVL